ncbi:DNA double-strand break repair nuclease NurA [Picrophilus oshimae]|uniref:NurA domain-containing protein n=1 Tax=Picrophilus torridus (strain ATCC 700027 / DSM 9790 / JCM 10055 / NBRC 100828 / KAW 2/3) TaxID=1122961 RepID=Q6L2H5_PICTO|nr:DNA double-strand break repair nuclease NurA [Picrophilus oshimae]AAT42827.1 hypothetical protein PTO0242 [Picrophilus oshimae DSM 9789]
METYTDFINYINSNLDEIRSNLIIAGDSYDYNIYKKNFDKYFHYYRSNKDLKNKRILAVDSSIFSRQLYSGMVFIMARAYSFSNKFVEKTFSAGIYDLNPMELRNFEILLMEHLEHKCVIKSIENERYDYIFIDGSYKSRLNHFNIDLKIPGNESFMSEYFSTMNKMISMAGEKGIDLIYIAKSSVDNSFRNLLINGLSNDEKSRLRNASDHLIIKSLAKEPGYTEPVIESSGKYAIMDILPEITDIPLKINVVSNRFLNNNASVYDIVDLIFYGYNGYRNYNIWLYYVDRMVKFRKKEVENLYMRTFERLTGIPFYESRGDRRARIHV